MKIGIDARLYSQTGVGRYLQNLLRELPYIDKHNDYYIFLRKEEFDIFQTANNRWHKVILDIQWHTFKEQFCVPYEMFKYRLDVTHFPYFNVPFFYPGKYLLTLHDLIIDHFDTGRASTLPPFYFKFKRFVYKYNLRRSIDKASYITVISKTTKNEVIDHYGVSTDKVSITYDALDSTFLQRKNTQKKENYYNFKYILYVGNAYPHKNLELLVKSFQLIRKKHRVKLVLAGNDQYFFPRLKKLVDNLDLSDDIVFFGLANDENLINLYSFAECLVFPSLMEGFGLPNFEALACNCLPVVSDIEVFRELWGDYLTYFDPNNYQDMSEKIIEVLELKATDYSGKIDTARKILDRFSWRKTAQITLNLYESINNKS